MIVGLDFDNTIVNYDEVFYAEAVRKGIINSAISPTKLAVRDDLRNRNIEDAWTELQGHVYGSCMDQADLFPHVIETLQWLRAQKIAVCIVSHKSKFPFLGPKYNLHDAAQKWIKRTLYDAKGPLVHSDNIYFCATKALKIKCISDLKCTVFLDDLHEIFASPDFPLNTQKVLFDPDDVSRKTDGILPVNSWEKFLGYLKQ